jgi:hypothetical protein
LIDDLLLRQSLRCSAFDGISAAAQRIVRAGGRVELVALASCTGVGMRQFERRFMQFRVADNQNKLAMLDCSKN